MKKRFFLPVLAAAVFLLGNASSSAASGAMWYQPPSMAPPGNAYSFSSETQVPSQVADDFYFEGGFPIVGVTWWGSYWDTTYQDSTYFPYPNSDSWGDPAQNPPGVVSGFIISFYADISEGQGVPPWGHPGSLLYAATIPMDGVQLAETPYGAINRDASTQTVFQYDASLPIPFVQDPEKVCWLSIQAIDPGSSPLQWGWQESMDHWNGNAVQHGFSSKGWWDLLPGEDMAYKLNCVPIPPSLILFGAGCLGLIGLRRRPKRGAGSTIV